jgi:hypothetical protein
MRSLTVCCLFVLAILALAPQRATKDTPSIVGKWEALADKEKVMLEFTKAGALHLSGYPRSLADILRCARILSEFNAKPEIMALKYKLLRDNKLEIESDWSKLLKSISGEDPAKSKDPKVRAVAKGKVREVVKVAISGTTLTITSDRKKRLTFKRKK